MVSSRRNASGKVDEVNKSTDLVINEMMNAVYKIYPSLANKITKHNACKVIDTIVMSHMICNGFFTPSDCIQDRKVYARQMMTYDREVREIADSLGLDKTVVVEFVQGCFEINGANGIYPSSHRNSSSLWPMYAHLQRTFSEYISKTIIRYICEPISAKLLRHTFKAFARIVRLYRPAPPHALFIIEACNYIAHIHANKNVVPGQSTKIFVDDFVNHLRDFDEKRYLKYENKLTEILELVEESFTPDCSTILCAFGLNELDSCILRIRNGFKWFPIDQIKQVDKVLSPVTSPHLNAPDEWALPPPFISGPLPLTRVATVVERMSKNDDDRASRVNDDEEEESEGDDCEDIGDDNCDVNKDA